MKLVTAVRPYAPRIRTRVFDHLRAAGCDILEENIVEAGTSDEEAVRAVLARNTPVLLVPFHAHRDRDGRRVDGLGFLRALDEAATKSFPWHVIMPVSAFAVPAVTAQFARGEVASRFRERILVITEDELDDPSTSNRIRDHLCR